MDYSKDFVIGSGAQGPFDHFLALKNINQSSCRQDRFNPNDLLLYAVTDSGMNRKWGRSIAEAVKAAIEGGATIVQLRFVTLTVFFLFCIILILMHCIRETGFYASFVVCYTNCLVVLSLTV